MWLQSSSEGGIASGKSGANTSVSWIIFHQRTSVIGAHTQVACTAIHRQQIDRQKATHTDTLRHRVNVALTTLRHLPYCTQDWRHSGHVSVGDVITSPTWRPRVPSWWRTTCTDSASTEWDFERTRRPTVSSWRCRSCRSVHWSSAESSSCASTRSPCPICRPTVKSVTLLTGGATSSVNTVHQVRLVHALTIIISSGSRIS